MSKSETKGVWINGVISEPLGSDEQTRFTYYTGMLLQQQFGVAAGRLVISNGEPLTQETIEEELDSGKIVITVGAEPDSEASIRPHITSPATTTSAETNSRFYSALVKLGLLGDQEEDQRNDN